MKILVTGANGQVGSEIIKRSSNYSFIMEAASRHILDISDAEQVRQYIAQSQPDIIINAAAYTAVDAAESDQKKARAINELGVKNLANSCQQLNIPLFHISTDYVFDGLSTTAYIEQDKPEPQNIYGQTKLAGELCAMKTTKHLILRVSWVFGNEGNNFVKTMLNLAQREQLNVVDDQVGAPTWAGDIAETFLKLAKKYQAEKTLKWGLYHYAGNQSVSWYQFAVEIFKQAKALNVLKQIPTVKAISSDEYPAIAIRPKNSVLNGSKIKNKLNIDLPDWHIGLQQVIKNWNAK